MAGRSRRLRNQAVFAESGEPPPRLAMGARSKEEMERFLRKYDDAGRKERAGKGRLLRRPAVLLGLQRKTQISSAFFQRKSVTTYKTSREGLERTVGTFPPGKMMLSAASLPGTLHPPSPAPPKKTTRSLCFNGLGTNFNRYTGRRSPPSPLLRSILFYLRSHDTYIGTIRPPP